jgi:hypothetical protein
LNLAEDLLQKGAHAKRSSWWKSADIPGILAVGILLCILVAGLWPFCAPRNRVTWIPQQNGLNFADPATVTTAGKSALKLEGQTNACSIEIWFIAGSTNSPSTLLAFYPPDRSKRLTIRQSISDLLLKTASERLYVNDVFQERGPVFVTLTSDASNVHVFVNGRFRENAPRMAIACDGLSGPLVLGTSPVQHDAWQGELLGLAFYQSALAPERVAGHFESWTRAGNPSIDATDRAVAIYPFRERTGNIAHSLLPSGADLRIPKRFQLLDEIFLASPMRTFYMGWGYWKDFLINVLGFLPLGFILSALGKRFLPATRAAIYAALAGCIVSLMIEILQSHLPTRHSDFTDVLTNSVGSCVGAWLYAGTPMGMLFDALVAWFQA